MPLTQTQSVGEKKTVLSFSSPRPGSGGRLETNLEQSVEDFLDYLTVEAGLSDNTVLAYGRDLKSFLKYCKSSNIKELQQISPALIRNYLQLLTQNQMSENSIKRCLVAIRMLMRFAKLMGLVEDDVTSTLESPKVWQRLPVICSKQQVVDLLDSPNSNDHFYLRDRAMLELLYATGIRASEVSGLEDVRFEP